MSIESSGNNSFEQWQIIAQRELASAQTKFFIDGDYRDAIDGARFDTINPANRETIAAVSAANEKAKFKVAFAFFRNDMLDWTILFYRISIVISFS